jgi:hypothetical protein
MLTFLLVLFSCIVGGFLVTALVWVLFWASGILDPPYAIRRFSYRFGKSSRLQIQGLAYRDAGWNMAFVPMRAESQAGTSAIEKFIMSAGFRSAWNSESQAVSAAKVQFQGNQNMAGSHAPARN